MALGLLFPGQGAQRVGMGRALARRYPAAAEVFARADGILGAPLSRLCWEGPAEELTLTRNAQPAILVHSLAVHRVVEEVLGPVSVAAGHSLGEFTAHVAAGTLSFEDALRAVRVRGELMHRAGVDRPGGMAAVLGLDEERVAELCREAAGDGGVCVPANFNAPGQVVVSGDVEAVERLRARAREAGARRVVRLPVSGAFHSPLMEAAREGLRRHLESITFRDPAFPVISNVTAGPVDSGARARELLVRQLTAPVRWAESVRGMLARGVDRFVELGPGAVLCGLVRRIEPAARCLSVGEPDEVEGLRTEGWRRGPRPGEPGGEVRS